MQRTRTPEQSTVVASTAGMSQLTFFARPIMPMVLDERSS